MFSALVSFLLLGTTAQVPVEPSVPRLPGIEILQIAAPSIVQKTLSVPPRMSASGMVLVDLRSGEQLLSRSAGVRRPMASLTKIMTALIILERHKLTEVVTIPPTLDRIRGSTVGLKAGERYTVGALLKALLIPSANDAAYALAIYDAGSVGAFVQRMNKRAAALGLSDTHFANPAGLDSEQQYSTPRDLSWLTMAALRHRDFRSIVATKTTTITTQDERTIDLRNTNELLHEDKRVFGVKTGTTVGAGECLIVLLEEGARPYLIVLLGAHDRYTDSLYLLQSLEDALTK